jgi:6-phosphogluconolactonase
MRTPRLAAPLALALAGAALTVGAATASAAGRDFNAGTVYTETNAAAGNQIAVFGRGNDGALVAQGTVSTGGLGTGSGLGSQGALAVQGNTLYAVNAGSSTISALRIGGPGGLQLVAQVSSGGTKPTSVTVEGRYLFVLNAGGTTPNITGFTTTGDALTPIPNSTRALGPTASSPEQIGFSPDGRSLVVAEKGSNTIDTFAVGPTGVPSLGSATASAGAGPYGFGFDNNQHLVISEAAAGSVSSYTLFGGGLFPVSLSVSTGSPTQGAPCWLVVSNDGRYAFSANAASNSISGFSIAPDGTLALLGYTNLGAGTSHPLDEAIGNDGHVLYNLNTDPATGMRQITALAVNGDGSLSVLGTFGTLPAADTGLAIR